MNSVTKLNKLVSVAVKFVAFAINVAMIGIKATTKTTSTTTPVMSIAPLTEENIFFIGFINSSNISYFIN